MINKLLSSSTPNLLTSLTCYRYKTLSSKIFTIRSPTDMINSFLEEKDMDAETMAQYCYKWVTFNFTDIGSRKMSQFIKTFDRINLSEATGEDVALYAALCSSGMEYNINAWGNSYSKILSESKKTVDTEVENLSNFALIHFYEFFHSYNSNLYMQKVADQMIKNMGKFSEKDYLSLTKVLRKIEIYSKKQKQLVTEMIHRLNILDENQTKLNLSLSIYSNLRNLNYPDKHRPQSSYVAFIKSMTERLINTINEMNEAQVTRCFNMLEGNDPLFKALFNNLITSIDENGSSSIPTQLFMKLLIDISYKKKLRSKDQTQFNKIYLFIENNFKAIRVNLKSGILKVIQNQFFQRNQLVKIQILFQKQNFLQNNYLYIYECLAQNIQFTSYDSFIETLPSLQPKFFSTHFFILCLTLKKMKEITPNIQQIEDMYEGYQKIIRQEIHKDYFWVWKVKKNMKISIFVKFCQSFDDVLWSNFPQPKQGANTKKQILTFLYFVNDKKRMKEYLVRCNYHYQVAKQFIDQISQNPELAANRIICLEIFIQAGIKFFMNKDYQKVEPRFQKFFNSLIVLIQSRQINTRLNPNDAQRILNLAIKILEIYKKTQMNNNSYLFEGIVSMINNLKQSSKDCQKYVKFLGVLLQKSVQMNTLNLIILKEAKRYGVVNQDLIGLWDKKQVQNSRMSDYIKLMSNKTIDSSISIDQHNLSGLIYQITRSQNLNKIFIDERKSQLIEIIKKSEFHELSECLFHFDSNAQLDQITNLREIKVAIIDALGEKDNLDKITNLKLQRILSSISSHGTLPGSLKLLKNLTDVVTISVNQFSFAFHEALVYQHLRFNYHNEKYISKLIEIIKQELRLSRLGRNQSIIRLLVNISSMEPNKSRMNLPGSVERKNRNILMSYFRNLFAEVDNTVIKSFKKFLENIKGSDIVIYEDIAKYIDIKSNGTLKTELSGFKRSTNPNKLIEQFLELIIGECQQNSMNVEKIEECGISILKISEQYVFFSANKVAASAKKLEVDYLETVFGEKIKLNEQKSNIHILHIHWSTPTSLVSQLCQVLNLPSNLIIDKNKVIELFKKKTASSQQEQKQVTE